MLTQGILILEMVWRLSLFFMRYMKFCLVILFAFLVNVVVAEIPVVHPSQEYVKRILHIQSRIMKENGKINYDY